MYRDILQRAILIPCWSHCRSNIILMLNWKMTSIQEKMRQYIGIRLYWFGKNWHLGTPLIGSSKLFTLKDLIIVLWANISGKWSFWFYWKNMSNTSVIWSWQYWTKATYIYSTLYSIFHLLRLKWQFGRDQRILFQQNSISNIK